MKAMNVYVRIVTLIISCIVERLNYVKKQIIMPYNVLTVIFTGNVQKHGNMPVLYSFVTPYLCNR